MKEIKFISPQESIVVRHPVLREGKSLESCVFLGDHFATTFHLGFFEDRTLVGVVSLMQKNYKNQEGIGYQLRGMAVLKEYQGKAIGKELVVKAENEVVQRYGHYIWMNARELAIGFYEKTGYQKVSDVFDIPGIGPHFTMLKNLLK